MRPFRLTCSPSAESDRFSWLVWCCSTRLHWQQFFTFLALGPMRDAVPHETIPFRWVTSVQSPSVSRWLAVTSHQQPETLDSRVIRHSIASNLTATDFVSFPQMKISAIVRMMRMFEQRAGVIELISAYLQLLALSIGGGALVKWSTKGWLSWGTRASQSILANLKACARFLGLSSCTNDNKIRAICTRPTPERDQRCRIDFCFYLLTRCLQLLIRWPSVQCAIQLFTALIWPVDFHWMRPDRTSTPDGCWLAIKATSDGAADSCAHRPSWSSCVREIAAPHVSIEQDAVGYMNFHLPQRACQMTAPGTRRWRRTVLLASIDWRHYLLWWAYVHLDDRLGRHNRQIFLINTLPTVSLCLLPGINTSGLLTSRVNGLTDGADPLSTAQQAAISCFSLFFFSLSTEVRQQWIQRKHGHDQSTDPLSNQPALQQPHRRVEHFRLPGVGQISRRFAGRVEIALQ